MSAIQTLFCDFDGPIADVADRYYATYCIGLKRLQTIYAQQGTEIPIQQLSQAQFWTFKQHRVPDRQIALWSGLEDGQIDCFLEQVRQVVNRADLLHCDRLQPRVRQALKLLRCHGVRVVIVTLRPPSQVHQFLRQHHLDWAVDGVFGNQETQAAYANQATHKIELLQAAIAHQQVQGYQLDNAWMIGDTEADILAGQAAGLPTVALTCGIRSRRYLRGLRPTHLLPDLSSAAQAYVRADSIVLNQR